MKTAAGRFRCLAITVVLAWLAAVPALAQPSAGSETVVREKVTVTRETRTSHEAADGAKAPEAETAAAVAATESPRRAAIFIKNRAGAAFADRVGAFEDMVVGEVTALGFRVVSADETLKAASQLLGTQADEAVPGAKLDELLENNAAATRLAQQLGVDYLLVVSIASFETDSQHLKRADLGIDRKVTRQTLRSTYKILDAARGESLSAGNVAVSRQRQATEGLEEQSDVAGALLAEAAVALAGKLAAGGGAAAVAPAQAADGMVSFTVACHVQDMTIPEVTVAEDGQFVLSPSRHRIEPVGVTVELDGAVIGSAPGTFQAQPGLHKIRLSREGFADWERTINVRQGQVLEVTLTLSESGRAAWEQMAGFLSKLKRDAQLSDAEAELVRGMAQQMRQSGLRVDRKVDIKVDTDDAPSVNQTNVERQNVTGSVWP